MSQHVRPQPRTRRLARFVVAFVVCATIGATPVLANTAQPAQAANEEANSRAGSLANPLPATFATGDSGRFKESIQ